MNADNIYKLTEQLKRHEGFRAKPYRCPGGALTIGYGRNLDAGGITKAEAEQLLENDIQGCINALHKNIPDVMAALTPNRQIVLINMCYNLGIQGLLAFKKTLQLIKQGSYHAASLEMLKSKWAVQVGHRANELSEMMRAG